MKTIFVICITFLVSAAHADYRQTGNDKVCSFSEFALVLDESSSIDAHQWKMVKSFAKKIVSAAGISRDGNRAGVASFAKSARIRINCNGHSDTHNFLKYIDGLEQTGTWTNIKDGLQKGKDILQYDGCGKRKDVYSRVLFLLTDGTPNIGGGLKALYKTAQSVRLAGIEIVAIGVGKYVDYALLKKLTGSNDQVFHVRNFDELTREQLINKLINPICIDPPVKKPVETTTTTTRRPTTTSTTTTPTTTTSTTTTTTPTTTTTTQTTTTTTPTTTTTTTTPTTTTTTPTTTTTTTTPTTTTTTTTPTTTTTTTTPTTTTPTTTTTTTVKIDSLCQCKVDESKIPALKLSVYDIERYPGNCRKEKVKNALKDIKKQTDKIAEYGVNFKNCRSYLRHRLFRTTRYTAKDILFNRIDECTVNLECKIAAWNNVLLKKKCKLEDELRWYSGTFGKIYDYGEKAYQQIPGIWK